MQDNRGATDENATSEVDSGRLGTLQAGTVGFGAERVGLRAEWVGQNRTKIEPKSVSERSKVRVKHTLTKKSVTKRSQSDF